MDEGLKKIMKELEAPFNRVFRRQGRAGQVWDYLANADVVNRLNKVFGLRWNVIEKSSEIVSGGRDDNDFYVIKRVQLEVEDPTTGKSWAKEAWGSHKFMTDDPADAHKSAFSKAITKAASLLGIGLYLYGLEEEEPDVAEAIINGKTQQEQNEFIPQEEEVLPEPVSQDTVVSPPAPMPNLRNPNLVPPQQTKAAAPPTKGVGVPVDIPLIHPMGPTTSKVVGRSPALGKPATAQAVIQQVELPQEESQEDNSPTLYQISTIKAVASMLRQDAMEIVSEVLGEEAANIGSLEELTKTQASRVLAEKRKIQVEGKYK